jgi:transposase
MRKHIVVLKPGERTTLTELIASGTAPARKLTHARILLKADQSDGRTAWEDGAISAAVDISQATVQRVRRLYVTEGLDAALNHRRPKRFRPRLLDGDDEAHLIALACSKPPTGHERWTLRLLAGKMVELKYVDDVSHETIRRTLKKTNSSPG